MLAVVIPTWNAARTLGATMASLKPGRDLIGETVVADGGSSDGTRELAEELGARVIAAPKGRGNQLREGIAGTRSDALLVLHADTRLSPDWPDRPPRHGRAGYFRLRLDDSAYGARRVERLANWRAASLGLPYGDQGLWLERSLYEAVGGYRPLPLMEDVDLVRRIGGARLEALPALAVTSADRYRRDGYWRRPFRNLACLSLYLAGLPPERIARFYG